MMSTGVTPLSSCSTNKQFNLWWWFN